MQIQSQKTPAKEAPNPNNPKFVSCLLPDEEWPGILILHTQNPRFLFQIKPADETATTTVSILRTAQILEPDTLLSILEPILQHLPEYNRDTTRITYEHPARTLLPLGILAYRPPRTASNKPWTRMLDTRTLHYRRKQHRRHQRKLETQIASLLRNLGNILIDYQNKSDYNIFRDKSIHPENLTDWKQFLKTLAETNPDISIHTLDGSAYLRWLAKTKRKIGVDTQYFFILGFPF
jgi:hypothetical protein